MCHLPHTKRMCCIIITMAPKFPSLFQRFVGIFLQGLEDRWSPLVLILCRQGSTAGPAISIQNLDGQEKKYMHMYAITKENAHFQSVIIIPSSVK